MKTFLHVAYVLFITASLSFTTKNTVTENTLTATYKGTNDNEYYKFIDDKNATHLFYDYAENITLDLEDDANIDKKFILTWKTKEVDELDEEGEETGDKITVKTILSIKEDK